MNWRRSCITDAFGPQKQTRPIYNIIVQYEQSIVKCAEKMEENMTQTRIHVYPPGI